MAKRNKQPAKAVPTITNSERPTPDRPALAAHPPAKNPTLLGVSIVLFALWFAFLLVTALFG
jgi:hypothetical protein